MRQVTSEHVLQLSYGIQSCFDFVGAMENIKHETHQQIIIDFYRNHQAKGKPYTVSNFAKMQVGRRQVYHAIERYESGASHQRQGKKGQPRKLTQDE